MVSWAAHKCSIQQTAVHAAYENKELTCGILSRKVATFPLKIQKVASGRDGWFPGAFYASGFRKGAVEVDGMVIQNLFWVRITGI
jgi:hypothetical protein